MSPLRITTAAAPAARDRLTLPALAVAGGLLALLAGLLLWPRPAAAPAPVATLATAAVACRPAGVYLETIQRQQAAGRDDLAAANAATALTLPDLCPDDRAVLASLAVTTALEALWAEPFPAADTRAQQAAVERLAEVEQLARRYGVALPSRRQLAGRAYETGKWLVAQQNWEAALAAGEIGCDRRQLQFYVSVLYNRGQWLLAAGEPAARREGLALLAAAHALDVRHRIGSGAAAGALRAEAGADEARWPAPAPVPLLTAPPPGCAG